MKRIKQLDKTNIVLGVCIILLQVGDIILAVENEMVNGHKTLTAILQEYESDKTIKLTILRNGKEKTVEVELDKLE